MLKGLGLSVNFYLDFWKKIFLVIVLVIRCLSGIIIICVDIDDICIGLFWYYINWFMKDSKIYVVILRIYILNVISGMVGLSVFGIVILICLIWYFLWLWFFIDELIKKF